LSPRTRIGFPELGRRYREQVVEQRSAIFARYLDRWAASQRWKLHDRAGAAAAFAGMLRAGVFDDALHGLFNVNASHIRAQAEWAAENLLALLKSGRPG
jgi:hypothetical protein